MGTSSSGNSTTSRPRCKCKCGTDSEGGQTGDPITGLDTPTGEPETQAPQLTQSSGGGNNMGLGDGVEYSGGGSGSGDGQYGNNWVNASQPRLVFNGSDVQRERGPNETVNFIKSGSGYSAEFFVRDVLTYDAVTKQYTVTSPKGDQQVYSKQGMLLARRDAQGNEAISSYVAGELTSVITGEGDDTVGYFYSFDTLGRQESVIMRVGGTTSAFDFRRSSYHYSATGNLDRVIMDEKRDGSWSEIETAYYRYFTTGTKKLRFVLNDHAYEQMHSVNPAWPEAASDAEVARYADVEYVYYGDGKAKRVKTNGGKYTYELSYAKSSHSGSTTNVWTRKTIVKMPDGSTRTYYYNRGLSLLLMKVSEPQPDGSTNIWYPICQQFDGNSRIVLSAPSSAVVSVDESRPTLFLLSETVGSLSIYSYDKHGNQVLEGIKKGTGGSLVKQRATTYLPHTVGGNTIYLTATVTEFRNATDSAASNPVTTSFGYTFHKKGTKETFQTKTVTTTLPAVPNAENGDGQVGTVKVTYDKFGFLTQQIDAVGMKTNYVYDLARGALREQTEDAGAGRLNLKTEYVVDRMGRTIRMLGPEHTISLAGVATVIRRAQWTQYFDSEDEIRTINGYVRVDDGSEHVINPVQISRHFIDDPEVEGGRIEQTVSAVYSGSGLPPVSLDTFPQSSYVRWTTQHFSRNDELTHSRLYHLIPDSGLGVSGTNYAQTNYGYDRAGRQNKTVSPEGTISLTVMNAMSWTLRTRTGTTDANMVSISVNEYDSGLAGGNGNLTKTTNRVESSAGLDRVALFRYDWRDRQIESESNDGSRTLISHRTYDNRGNVTKADEYQAAVSAANLINRAESFFDPRNRQYRTKRYGVTVGTGALLPALTSEVYYDQAGRTVRNTPAGKVGFTVMQYDTAGRTRRQFRAWGGTINLAAPGDISNATVIEQTGLHYDDAGNSVYTMLRQRFDDATGTGSLQNPTAQPKARVSYVATYPDALGRTVATANYGTNGGAAWTRSNTIPARSDTVLVSSAVFDDAGDQTESIDPMGTVTKSEFDEAGRLIAQIENYQP